MARYVAGILGTGAGSATLPIFSVYSAAAVSFRLREAAVFNTTTTASREKLARLTTAGTQGAAQTEGPFRAAESPAASCTAFTTHTGGPTITDLLGAMPMGAAIGSGTILTFYDQALECPVGTANGIGICPQGTGQVADVHMIWDEG